jgi:hypothetical protein
MLAHQVRFPFRHYKGEDGGKYYRWSLTRKEPIYRHFDPAALSLFQMYLLQWIEIENRAMRFLDTHHKHDDCFTLNSPRDLNDPDRVQDLFRFLDVPVRGPQVKIAGVENKNPRMKTVVSSEEERQFQDVIAALPESYLQIFRRAPYASFEWAARLRN